MILFSLIELDQAIFHLLNYEWTNTLFDAVLPIWRNKYFWIPVYLFIITFCVFNFWKKGLWLVLALIFTVGIADMTSSHLVKKSVKRVRPCNDISLNEVVARVRCGSGYSFTSSHAANHFAISMFLIFTLGRKIRETRVPLFLWAVSIAYAQVYVGVHYPLDVLGGAILGSLIAMITANVYWKFAAIHL